MCLAMAEMFKNLKSGSGEEKGYDLISDCSSIHAVNRCSLFCLFLAMAEVLKDLRGGVGGEKR